LSDRRGLTIGEELKVVKVEERGLLLGYVGHARVKGTPMCDWLRAFVGRHEGATLGELATRLAAELEAGSVDVLERERGTIVHLGGFENGPDQRPRPVIWYVRDAEIQPNGSVRFLGSFEARDELKVRGNQPPYFGDVTGDEILRRLREAETPLPWAGFRQSFDLRVFGVLDQLVWQFAALVTGIARETTHAAPTTLEEWARFLQFSVLCYAAYFEAFYPPGQRPVGGGVDIEYVPWPHEP
jgi:hypothetical protein